MQFDALPECDHPAVRLRPLTAADIPAWYGYLSQPIVFEHTSWNVASPADLARYAGNADTREPSTLLRLAIADRGTDTLVGTIGFHTVMPEHRSAELAYDLSPALWGKGIASHACRVMVDWAHAHAGLHRVQATVLGSNARSAKVLERCKFEREGLLRSFRMVRGRPGDFWMYSHVRSDASTPPLCAAPARARDMHAVHLRDAGSSDVPAITACVQAAYAPWIARIGRKPWPMLRDYAAVVEEQQVVVAEIGNELVGVLVQVDTDEGSLIENVAVRPDRKGRGIGRALLVHAERVARARGHRSVYLYTNELMTENIALYSRGGFVEYERRQETGFRRVFMRKALA